MTKRVLLDESVPRQLAIYLTTAGFAAIPYPNDWKQTKNGELLTLAEDRGFDALVTSDQSIAAQQDLRERALAIVVLPTNRRRHIMSRAADIADTLARVEPGQYVVIEASGVRTVVNYDLGRGRASEMPPVAPFNSDRE